MTNCETTKYVPSLVWRLVKVGLLLICSTLLSSCDLTSRYGRYDGIEFIAGRGNPPASGLIWSRTSQNTFLVNASNVGPELSLRDSKVYTLDIASNVRSAIAETTRGVISGETWSPDGQRVVLNIFPSTKGYEDYEGLWIWDAKTNSLEFLASSGLASWSPDGNTIAILDSSHSDGYWRLSLVDMQTKKEESVSLGSIEEIGYVWSADWSPDTRFLVLSIGDPPSSLENSLFVYDLQMNALKRLTSDGNDSHPVWSPLGKYIAYIKHIPSTSVESLHILNPESTCDIEIPNLDFVLSPTWSPDGQQIAFIGPDAIYSLDVQPYLIDDLDNCK